MKKSDRRHAKPDLFDTAETAPNSTSRITFTGTENPRYLRAIRAMQVRPVTREQLDRVAGCSNGPALIAGLRDMGLGKGGLPCTMIPDRDRDGNQIRRGVYSFSKSGRRAIEAWLRKRKKGAK